MNYFYYLNHTSEQRNSFRLTQYIRTLVALHRYNIDDPGDTDTDFYPQDLISLRGHQINFTHPNILRQFYKSLVTLYAIHFPKRFGLSENPFFQTDEFFKEHLTKITKPLWYQVHKKYLDSGEYISWESRHTEFEL